MKSYLLIYLVIYNNVTYNSKFNAFAIINSLIVFEESSDYVNIERLNEVVLIPLGFVYTLRWPMPMNRVAKCYFQKSPDTPEKVAKKSLNSEKKSLNK